MSLGQQIRMLRKGRGWRLKDLGEATGISVPYLSDVENGRCQPSGNLLVKIAEVFEVDIDLMARESFQRAHISAGLVQFAREAKLTNEEVLMLARLTYRRQRPQSAAAYRFLWDAIRLTCGGLEG